MTYFEPPAPVVPDLDARIRSAVNKYTRPSDPTFAAELSSASPLAVAALRDLDIEKLSRGSRAMTQPASAVGLRAATTNESTIGDPDESILGDFVRNTKELVGGLPRLPQALAGEIADLPGLPKQAGEVLSAGDSPVETLGNLANLPGLRMIPGSYVAGQFGTDGAGVKGLVDNPLFTALDVLPYASKAAGATRTVKAMEAAALPGQRVGKFSTLAKYAKPGGPTFDAAGQLERNALGRQMARAADRASETLVGNKLKATFGRRAGDIMQKSHEIAADYIDPTRASAENAPIIELRSRLDEAGKGLSAERRAELSRLAQTDFPAAKAAAVNADELAYVELAERAESTLLPENLASGDLMEIEVSLPGGRRTTEVYDARTGGKILKARAVRDRVASLASTRANLASRVPSTLDEFASSLAGSVDVPMSAAERGWLIRSELHRLDLAGYDTTALKKGLEKAKKNKASVEAFHRDLADRDLSTLAQKPFNLPARDELVRLGRSDPMVKAYLALSDAGSWQKASEVARTLAARGKFTGGVDWTDVTRHARVNARMDKALKWGEKVASDKALAAAERGAVKAVERAVPARYQRLVAEKMQSELASRVLDAQSKGLLSPDDAAKASELIALEVIDAKSLPESVRPIAREVSREVRKTWTEFAEQGMEPMFVHRTRQSKIGMAPEVKATKPSMSQVQSRVFDFGSTVDDIAVAIDAQAAELLSARASRQFQDYLIDTWSRPYDDLTASYRNFAKDAHRRNPNVSANEHMRRLIERKYRPISTYRGEVWVPRDVAEVAKAMGPKQFESAFMRTYDATMGVFRTALLPLSPRWHIYNMIGGAIMMTAEHGPGVWRELKRGWDAARNGDLANVKGMPAMGASTRSLREATQWARNVDLSTPRGKALATWDVGVGRFLGRLWDESEAVAKARRGGSAVLDRSYAFNEMFDDMYRSMSYLYGEGKALRKGMSAADAEMAGVASARKVLANWDRMTPIERSIIRSVFPWYSWTKHLLGYTMRFPFDHPIRTSITASLVQAELEDFGTGLPQALFSMIDVTGPAEFLGMDVPEGERMMLNMDGMNPFRDVGSWASLASFLGSAATGNIDPTADIGAVTAQSAPSIQFLLKMAGVDPAEGMPDPYSAVTLDPSTGQLRTVNEFNPVSGFAESIVPQSRILMDLMGQNQDFQRLLASNPEAAQRRLLSSAGLPAAVSDAATQRTVSPEKEIIKAEARRYEDVLRTKSEALRSGNLDKLDRYPRIYGDLKKRLEEARRRGLLVPDEDEIKQAIGQ